MAATLERFKAEYQDYNGLGKSWRDDQSRALRSLTKFSAAEDPSQVTPENYGRWLGFLNENLSPSTVKKYGMCARAYYGWAFRAGLYDAADLLRIRETAFPPAPPRKPRPYGPKEIKQIWPALEKAFPYESKGKFIERWRRGTSKFKRIEEHANHLQAKVVIRLALDCGLRRQEIFDLSMDDMHYDNAFVVVREGKEGKFREVPYTQAARAAVREWFEFRAELGPKHDRWLLSLTKYGPPGVWLRPMSFRRFAIYLGDLGDWQLHRLRHTCATNWLRVGMDIEVLKELLGHSSIQQTMEYTELVKADVAKQVAQHEGRFEAAVAA